jgi:hypothetical protein
MKNLTYSMSEPIGDDYRNIYSVKRLFKHNFINILPEDGDYPFYIKETSWYSFDEIPEDPRVLKLVDENYKDFTIQIIRGTIRIKEGKIDTKHLNQQIPEDWWEWNNHTFLEGMEYQDGVFRLHMGS